MAETRKHRITIRDELDAQLIAQLGEEPVRPYEAGSFHRRDGAASAAPDAVAPASTPPTSVTKPGVARPGVTPPGVVGSFTFTAKHPPTSE